MTKTATAGLDFAGVEQLLEDAAGGPIDTTKKSDGKEKDVKEKNGDRDKKRKRSKSRSRSREQRHEKEKEREKKRESEREAVVSDRNNLSMRELEASRREETRRREEEEERVKAIEDATRGERTVMVASLPLKADERDIYEFFTSLGNSVRDVQIIRDARTGRSKGVGYIEFSTTESAMRALSLNGRSIRGHNVMIQPSRSEKNRMGNTLAGAGMEAAVMPPMEAALRLYVSGLVGGLANIDEAALRKLFVPFGDLDFVDVQKGFAFVQFRRSSEGRAAIGQLDNFVLAGQRIKVGVATPEMSATALAAIGNPANLKQAALPAPTATVDLAAASPYISLLGMFSPGEVNLKKDPNFYKELEEEISEEVEKFGKLKGVYASRSSRKNPGLVWIRFGAILAAEKCREALDKRFFGGKRITARFVTEAEYKSGMASALSSAAVASAAPITSALV